ncbi:MAG: Asp-tRNA(Asn)/Glu-tRNA(Gln) amidotransferase subunit GatB [Candidatus Nanoarchaeia archaeon]
MVKVMIGLEIHVQLNTRTKIFCSCPNSVSDEPNTLVCDICLGMPGSKPSFNKEVLMQALKVALALNCKVNSSMFFSRKSYFYPDMPKNFQITQFEVPLAENGELEGVRVKRVHMEEDPGRLVHSAALTLVDYNRSGVPLLEIVTEPDFKSPEQVRDWLNKLITILEYLNVYYRASEASLRADANISIDGGERVEIKNIGGVKDIERALNFEVERQQKERAVRETRGWDSDKGVTISLRRKETEEDYGYIFEPDLTEFEISEDLIDDIRSKLPELASKRANRFIENYKIDATDAHVLTQDILIAELFEKVAKKIDPVLAARWLRRDLLKLLNYNKKTLKDLEIDESHIIDLLSLVESKQISDAVAKDIMIKLMEGPFDVKEYVKENNLLMVSDASDLEVICDEVIRENPRAVEDYKSGRKEALNFLFGIVVKKTGGRADPNVVRKLLEKKIR